MWVKILKLKNKRCPKSIDFHAGPFFLCLGLLWKITKHTPSRILACIWSGQFPQCRMWSWSVFSLSPKGACSCQTSAQAGKGALCCMCTKGDGDEAAPCECAAGSCDALEQQEVVGEIYRLAPRCEEPRFAAIQSFRRAGLGHIVANT